VRATRSRLPMGEEQPGGSSNPNLDFSAGSVSLRQAHSDFKWASSEDGEEAE
jgi:hypothetical protein